MPTILVLVLIFIILLILVSCIRIVPQAQAMVVERLGAYLETWNVGIHFKVPFIDRVAKRVLLKEQVVDFAPQPVITKDGIYTQGIFGFLNMLTKIEKDYEPGYLTVAFDLKAPTFRHQEYKDYKAGRKKMPPELAMQMPLLKDILQAMNIKILEKDLKRMISLGL